MRILIACETSGVLRDAFRRRGHDAYSCDINVAAICIMPNSGRKLPDSGIHIQGDALSQLEKGWDMMVAFPPCTHLSGSGARYWREKWEDGRQQEAITFFMQLATANIPRIAVENPVGRMSTVWRKPDQIIQPWQFGHPESKATCLWLKNLPLLTPTRILQKPPCGYWQNQTPSGQNKLGPSPHRGTLRGLTYRGIAEAMAEQWGKL